jgi:acyl transferase domain-containing protein
MQDGEKQWLPSLCQGRNDWAQILESLGRLYVDGVPINWKGFDGDYQRRRVMLPTYPFQRERHWAMPKREEEEGHPLLGHRLTPSDETGAYFVSRLSTQRLPYLADHKVYGIPVLPAAALVEMVVAAAAALGPGPWRVEDIMILKTFAVLDQASRSLHLSFELERSGATRFRIYVGGGESEGASIPADLHAHGTVRVSDTDGSPAPVSLEQLRSRFKATQSVDTFYQALGEKGLEYGPEFQVVEQIWNREQEALGIVRLSPSTDWPYENYYIHPALLDGCFQLTGAAISGETRALDTYIPFGIEEFKVFRRAGRRLWCLARVSSLEQAHQEVLTAELTLFDEEGNVVASCVGLSLKRVTREQLRSALAPVTAAETHSRSPRSRPHPLLGARLATVADRPDHYYWEIKLDCEQLPYKGVYKLRNGAVLPLSAFEEMARASAVEIFEALTCAVSALQMHNALLIPKGAGQIVQTSLAADSPGTFGFRVYSRPMEDGAGDPRWTLHATALINL